MSTSLVRSITDQYTKGQMSWDGITHENHDEAAESLCLGLDVPLEQFSKVYDEAEEKGVFNGEKEWRRLVPAMVRLAGKDAGEPRTYRQIINAFPGKLTVKELARAYKRLCRDMDRQISPASVTNYVDHMISRVNAHKELEVDDNVDRLAHEVAQLAQDAKHVIGPGTDPSTLAASSVYIAAKAHGFEEVTQSRLEEATLVSDATIRTNHRKIIDYVEDDDEVDKPWGTL